MIRNICIILILILYAFVSVSFAKAVNVLELAEELGFNSSYEIKNIGNGIPANKYQKKKLFDENLYRRVLQIYNKIKDFDHNNYLPRSTEAMKYSNAFRDLKYRINHYFKIREEVIAAHKKEKSKRDIYALLKNHDFPTDYDQLRQFGDKIYQPTEKMLRDDGLYKKIHVLYSEIQTSKKKDFDRSDRNRRILIDVVFGILELRMSRYLDARNDLVDEEVSIKKERASAGQKLIETYQSTPAPSMLSDLKEMVSKINGWKIFVTKNIHDPHWNVMAEDGRSDSENLVFNNPPLDTSAYKNKYIIIQATITRALEDKYVISPYNYSDRALAKISKRIISQSDARFNQEMFMLCRLVDVIEAQTVFTGTKPVSVVEVVKMVPKKQYHEFSKYVAGHPNEFPQKKYVRIQIYS